MGMFVISKRYNDEYKFTFSSRKGKTIFTSIGCKNKEDCERMIAGIKANSEQFTFTKYKKASDKHFFRISKEGLVLANSRKYTTDLLLQKGMDEFIAHSSVAEILDFSENSSVFIDEEVGFELPK